MYRLRPYVEEMTRALLVLALILLNLAHSSPPAVAYDGFAFTKAAAVFCGDAGLDDQSAHAPCHACRIGSEALPPSPPCHAVSILLEAAPVIYSPVAAAPQADLYAIANRSRGPPLHA